MVKEHSTHSKKKLNQACQKSGIILHLGSYAILIQQKFFISIRGQQGNRGNHLLFHSTTSTRSQTFRHLVATLHVRWLSHIFNHTACIYQTATRWDLPPYRITNRLTKCASHPDKTASVIGLRRVTLLKRDSTTGVSLWNLW